MSLLFCVLLVACAESSGSPRTFSPPASQTVTARELVDPAPYQLTKRSGVGVDSIHQQTISDDLATLTTPAWQGRGAGTEGAASAASFLEGSLLAMGLSPAGDDGSFRHSFEVPLGVEILPHSSLADSEGQTYSSQDFTPLAASQNGKINAKIVFVKHGRSGYPFAQSDYQGVSVKGKVALIIREMPEEAKDIFSSQGSFNWYQLYTARSQGAKAVLFVSSMPGAVGVDDALPSLERATRLHASKLIVAQVRRYVAASWLASSGSVLGEDATPKELSLSIVLSVQMKQKKITQHNIVGRIEGWDPSAAPIIIGAHYDHLGLDVSHSLAHGEAPIPHLGADDNASGTSAVLSLAHALQTNPVRRRRSIMICFFAAEELGLLGSEAFVKRFKAPSEEIFAMLNLDMVGRFTRYVYVLAADRSPYWTSLLAKANAEVGLPLYPMRDEEGRSDHASFLERGVPALLFFTWFHPDYHTPSDTKEKINIPRLTQITRLVFYLATQLDGVQEL